jgi:hypothetical protein
MFKGNIYVSKEFDMRNSKKMELLEKKIELYRTEACFLRENLNNRKAIREYLDYRTDGMENRPSGTLPSGISGDEAIDMEMKNSPSSGFAEQVDGIRQMSLQALTKLSKNDESYEYEFFKKIWMECDKYRQNVREANSPVAGNAGK